MEKPVEMMLADKREDFPFMLCWANANWGRNWEGGHNITLIEQKYSDEDDIAHFEYLLPFLRIQDIFELMENLFLECIGLIIFQTLKNQ